jgi:hypothetical protein
MRQMLATWNIDAGSTQAQGFTVFIKNSKLVIFSDELQFA